MINSKGSVVVGGERSQSRLVSVFVVPDGGGEGEDALEDAGGDAAVCSSAVFFEVELAFEGVVHRLDDLAQRFEESGTGAWSFVLECGSQQPGAAFGEERLELATRVALVGDHGL